MLAGVVSIAGFGYVAQLVRTDRAARVLSMSGADGASDSRGPHDRKGLIVCPTASLRMRSEGQDCLGQVKAVIQTALDFEGRVG